ncbi:DUF5403 family protein [Lentzea flava]|uniref:Bacteriophage HK97-gp10, tail-component n=1 Tax=Lentzea flava TaxID=103732 RepID=A0ABQ2UNL2_9PSEU|nr:DUF5403 family protein [Lentzea flava]MCP2200068.1 hypothetical protein [Lentzea flava]GGU45917.1 hypothetical protein GCM10010178_43030 [Lentzea flava]
MAEIYYDIADTIAHLPGVRQAVKTAAETIAAKAKADLASHRKTGKAEIEVEHRDTDSSVSLVDEAAVSIEYGHFVDLSEADEVVFAKGLYIIHRAAGLI